MPLLPFGSAPYNQSKDTLHVKKAGDTMSGELYITYAYPQFQVTNTNSGEYSGAGFYLLNNTSSMGNQAGVTFYAGINNLSATQGYFSLDSVNTSGGGTGHMVLWDLNAATMKSYYPLLVTPTTNSTTAFQVSQSSGTQVMTVDSTDSLVTIQGINNSATKSAQLLASKTFTNSTYWTLGTGWTASSTTATATAATGNLVCTTANYTTVIGDVYQVTCSINVSSGGVTLSIGGNTSSEYTASGIGVQYIVFSYTAVTTGQLTFTPDATLGFTGTIKMSTSITGLYTLTASNSLLSLKDSTGSNSLEVRGNASSQYSLALGTGAMKYSTSTVLNDVAIGYQALQVDQTGANIAIGYNALNNNTEGANNIAVGASSQQSNISGISNIGIGINTLNLNIIGSENTAIGGYALQYNVNGNYNTAIGYSSLNFSGNGSYNMAIGVFALYYMTTGSSNTAIGYYAALNMTSGSNNIFIGPNTAPTLTGGSSNIIIGYGIDVPAASTSNYMSLGNVYYGNTSSKSATTTNNTLDDGSGGVSFKGSQTINRTTVADTAYSVATEDYLIAYTSLSASRAVTLPSASSYPERKLIVKDESGSAGTYNITLTGTVDGATNKAVTTAYGDIRVYSNGTNWFTW